MHLILALFFAACALGGTVTAQLQPMYGPLGGSITFLYSQGSDVLAGTASGHVFSSTDHGRSWSWIGRPTTKSEVACITRTESAIIVGTSTDGIYVSLDEGSTWITGQPHIVPGFPMHVLKYGNYVICTQLFGEIRRSTDDGRTWTSHRVADLAGSSAQFNSLTTLGDRLVVTTLNGAYSSGDSGRTWRLDLSRSFRTAVTLNGRLFAFGSSWYQSKHADWCLSTTDLVRWDSTTAPAIPVASAIEPTSLVVADYLGKLYRSDDNAVTWQPLAPSTPSKGVVRIVPSGSEFLIATTGSGTYRGGLDDSTLVASHDGQAATHIHELTVDQDRLVALGSKEGLFSLGKGASWITVSQPPAGTPSFRRITRVGDTLFATGEPRGVFASTDDGVSWVMLDVPINTLRFANGTVYYDGVYLYASSYSELLRSSDAGQSWASAANPPLARFESMTSYRQLLWGLDTDEGVFVSTNHGDDWTALDDAGDDVFTSMEWSNDTLFVGTSRGVVFYNAAGRVLGRRHPSLSVKDLHLHDGHLILASTTGVYVNGRNLGGSFEPSSVIVYNDTLYAGSRGQGVWSCAIASVLTSVEEATERVPIMCYPNPTGGARRLHVPGSHAERSISMIDVLGRTILHVTTTDSGIDITDIPPGRYAVVVREMGNVMRGDVIVTE